MQQTSSPPASACAECPRFGAMHMAAADLIIYLTQCFSESEMFWTKLADKLKKNTFMFNINFSKIVPFKRCGTIWYDGEKVQFVCPRDRGKNRHTFVISNTCCFSTATVLMRTRFNLTWCIQYISCLAQYGPNACNKLLLDHDVRKRSLTPITLTTSPLSAKVVVSSIA